MHQRLLELYRYMYAARRLDAAEQSLVARGDAFFHVSGGGHEAGAALAMLLNDDDWLFPHYRSKALMLARGVTFEDFLNNLLCNDHSSSRGRQLCSHLSDRRHNIAPMSTPVGNNALQAVGVAAAVRDQTGRPIVLCGAGDGTTQEGEFLEAVAEASRRRCPVLFLIEDNGWAISTSTDQRTFYSAAMGAPDHFHGVGIVHVDGRDAAACLELFQDVTRSMRHDRLPRIVVLHAERLASHTNADDQRLYRSPEDIERARQEGDPIQRLEARLLGHASALAEIRAQVDRELQLAEERALSAPDPTDAGRAKAPLRVELSHPVHERRGDPAVATLSMKDALRLVLNHRLQQDSRVSLLGQDIEDPKGDVFGVTRGLSTQFPGRVLNAPLAEATIVGLSMGQALAGARPVAMIQFADFLSLAHNQITNELATLYWRSDGQWNSPVIVMAPYGAYRPGLGPFHSHSGEATYLHAPGLDVVVPATAGDAAGLLNAAFESGRPTLFLYPKALLNDSACATSADVHEQLTPLGVARKVRAGQDLTLVSWGNTVRICQRVAEALESAGVEAEVLDLRSLSPWDRHAVLASAEKTSRLIVVHEDVSECGFGAEILAYVGESARVPVAMRRVARENVLLPCHFPSQLKVMPTFQRTLEVAADMLKLDLRWIAPTAEEPGIAAIEAIGSGPSDESVTVVEIHVQPGQTVKQGDVVASLEATKSVFDLTSSINGVVAQVCAAPGDSMLVGSPLFKLRVPQAIQRRKPLIQENPGKPVLTRRKTDHTVPLPATRRGARRPTAVGMSDIASVLGRRTVGNDELLALNSKLSSEDIVRRTGIESRRWVSPDQDAVSMAIEACWQTLEQHNLTPDDLDLMICSTTSPTTVTPSMACRVLNGLARGKNDAMVQAYDINAACSGYLYALQAGYDYLQSDPDGRVLIVTTEVLSPLLDPQDLDTAILFGDAATATVLSGETYFDPSQARLHRPELSAKPEDGTALSVPFTNAGFIKMQGRRVFSEAVRLMVASLNRACEHRGLNVDDLSVVIPHQANQRILDAVQNRIAAPVYSNIRRYGNTSSSSIPLCLNEVLRVTPSGESLGMCAFGGGFTFGAGILERI